ncbi:ATP-binding cassette G family transporter ABCG77 [Cardiosporidium cionae]|uniref:ATP-binding cassette G family transporter ABCG77 n=1 Tax=Cardiosporidium cionae TaxID=476202 RepID=A0ABQ7J593_9APIC|nr:ATP-binding cassette G family transporter ABCG77 [Cardiosporidium cionae]|eukprot:KAF8817956.1 ATP-binding cassette G family transporter ABCG77 [Cardiosporidium cionae]
MQSNKQLSTSLFEHSQTYDLTFKDISYEVVHGKKKTILEILHSVSGSAPIGEVTGILGPSGAGKTTLLNILSWRNYGKVYGEILLNGKPRLKNQKKRIGYVMQKDYFFAELSIEETLRYTALLRRGGGKNHQEINVMVKEVISMMGLERCAQTLLGDPFVRGISGGELKRVNIGNELLVDPSILFLDEPTSGLDSTSAVAVLRILRRVAQTYLKTVVLSIHQPSSMAFLMLDKVICMTNGHIIYQGPSLELADYLGVIGYPLPLGWNVADHVMDLLCDASMVDSLLTAYRHYLCMDASTGRYFMGFKESPQLSLASTNNSQSGTIPTSSEEPLSVGEEISSQKLPSLTEVRIENAPLHEEGENITKETSHLKEKKENSSKASMNTSDAPNMLRLVSKKYL